MSCRHNPVNQGNLPSYGPRVHWALGFFLEATYLTQQASSWRSKRQSAVPPLRLSWSPPVASFRHHRKHSMSSLAAERVLEYVITPAVLSVTQALNWNRFKLIFPNTIYTHICIHILYTNGYSLHTYGFHPISFRIFWTTPFNTLILEQFNLATYMDNF